MKIEWGNVKKPLKIFLVAFLVGFSIALTFQLGKVYQTEKILGKEIAKATFVCPSGEKFVATFYDRMVNLEFAKGKPFFLPQTISASGARYANKDESFVFWNKGDTAFIEQNGTTTLDNCVVSQ